MRGLLFLAVLAVSAACAETAASHKGHEVADYKPTPMPPPKRMTGIGDSHLKITTKSAEAQAFFDQGLSLLHCFWDFEAYRAFKYAVHLDPKAPMAYWGIVESISDFDSMKSEKEAALEKIKQLLPSATEHEQFYLRAEQKLNSDDDGAKDAWRKEMEALIDTYPDDIDAKLFLAIKINEGYDADERPDKDQVYADMLVEQVLHEHPNSAAAHHYRIHILESGPHAERALPDAEVLAKLVPGSGHMVHMPGHIFYKTGDYERARASFLEAKKVDEDYMRREKVGVLDDWNYPHNLSYLIAADAEAGRYREALETTAALEKLPANLFLAKNGPGYVLTVGGSEARLNIRYRRWQAVADHPIALGMDEAAAGAAAAAYRDGILHYARGMLALEKRDATEAARQSDALDATSWRLHEASDEDKPSPKRVLQNLEMLSLDLRGNLRMSEGKTDEGVSLLQQAVEKEKEIGYGEPPQYGALESESLGYAYIRAHAYDKAREAFQAALRERPKNGHALYGMAQSYEAAGDQKAAAAYRTFLEAWPQADPDLEMVKHAQSASR